MATTIRELLVRLGVQADDRALERFDRGLNVVRRTMATVAAAASTLAGAAGIGAITAATVRQGDEAAKTAQRIGATAEEVQELGFAAERTGAQLHDVEVALKTQARVTADAARGQEEAIRSYRALGMSVRDENGAIKEGIPLLEESADAFAQLATDQERTVLAQRLFGEEGVRLIPLLRRGKQGIRELRQEARQLGFVLSNEDAKSTEDFTDRLADLRKIAEGFRNRLVLAFIPSITSTIERFRDWFFVNREIIDQRFDEVAERIADGLALVERAAKRADEAVKAGPGSWGELFRQLRKIVAAAGIARLLLTVVPAAMAAGSALLAMATPATLAIGLLAAAILGAVLILEDFVVFVRGGNSVIGDFLTNFERAEPFLEGFNRLIASSIALLTALFAVSSDAAAAVRGPFVSAIEAVLPGLLSWETGLKAVDALLLSFVLNVETRMMRAAEAIELVTLALTDLRAFGAEVFGRVAQVQRDASGTAGRVADFADDAPRFPGPLGFVGRQGARGLLRLFEGGAGGLSRVSQFGADTLARRSDAFAPVSVEGGSTTNNDVRVEGDTINITGGAASPEEIASIIERRSEARQRQRLQSAMAAARGGER